MEGDDGKSFLAQGPGNWPPRPSVMSGGRNAANTVTIQPSWLSRDGGDALRGNKLRSTTGMGGTGRGDMADAPPKPQTIKSRSTAQPLYQAEAVVEMSRAYDTHSIPGMGGGGGGDDGVTKLPSVTTGKPRSSLAGTFNTRPKSRDSRSAMGSRGGSRGNPLGNPGLPLGSAGARVPLGSDRDGLGSSMGRRAAGGGGDGAALITQRHGDGMASPPRRTGGTMNHGGGGGGGGGVNINAEAAGIHTSNDVIEYYVGHGLSAAIKLFYCVQAPMGDSNYTPYDLLVVSKEMVANKDVEHFTVSSSGVVHIRPGIQSEFTPLGEWMRDSSIFNLLRQMRFFRYYLVQKMFSFWRSNVRHKLYRQVRAKLERTLFIAKPTFNASVMELGALCHELRDTALVSFSNNQLYTVEDFGETQVQHRTGKAVPKMESVQERVQKVLERVIRDVVGQEKRYREIADNDSISATVSKTKSMVALKRERIERARTYKRIVEESQMLPSLVQLADYMISESLVSLVLNNLSDLLALLANPNKSKGIFLTTVAFAHELTTFTPNEPEVLKTVNTTVVEGILASMGSMPRLIFMRAFAPLFEAGAGPPGALNAGVNGVKFEGLSPMAVLTAEPEYARIRDAITECVTASFIASREYTLSFEDHRQIYRFGLGWNQAEYEQTPKTAGQFRADMRVQREWRTELDRMKVGSAVGIMYVDSRALRTELSGTVLSMLESMKALLLVAAREEVTRVLDEFQKRVRTLVDRPEALDRFAHFMEVAKQHEDLKPEYDAEHVVVAEMYDMLVNYEMKIPAGDQVKLDDLNEAVAALADSMARAKEYTESRKAEMMGAMAKGITELDESLLGIQAELNSAGLCTSRSQLTQSLKAQEEFSSQQS